MFEHWNVHPETCERCWGWGRVGRYDPTALVFGNSLSNATRLLPGVQVGNTNWFRLRSLLLLFGNSSRGSFRPGFPIKLNALQVKEQNANTLVYVSLIAGIQRKCVYFCPRSVPGSMAPIFSSHTLLLIWDFWLSSESEGLTAQRYMSQTGRNSLFFFKTPVEIDFKKEVSYLVNSTNGNIIYK